jgi:hypothetical protein
MANLGYTARPFLCWNPSFGLSDQDSMFRAVTCGLIGTTAAADVELQPFVYHLPQGPKDYIGGGACAATGYWGANSGMVTVDGMRFLRDFAPTKVVKPGP